ncbi:unnamed protein product [Pleuronectes platessa]|uniref:Uncharacterized protein n=1 Tax=Pleuronectes platessa TaxID=8262 RepID=A0A9N7UAF1_PLEPL|nr:unnamed protein product [Pleuronectes platessa]
MSRGEQVDPLVRRSSRLPTAVSRDRKSRLPYERANSLIKPDSSPRWFHCPASSLWLILREELSGNPTSLSRFSLWKSHSTICKSSGPQWTRVTTEEEHKVTGTLQGTCCRAAGPPGALAHPTSTVGARVSTALTRASLFNMPVATTEKL